MSVTSVQSDTSTLTLSFVSEFDAPVSAVWQVWENPRLLERWWGPPTYPATFVTHDLAPGGGCTYFMTGPSGDQPHGWWKVLNCDAPHRLSFESGFAHPDGTIDPSMPVMVVEVSLESLGSDTTRMSLDVTFASLDAMERIMTMGMQEGMSGALSQIDSLL